MQSGDAIVTRYASGAVAGAIARSDNERGWWASPSNLELNGVVGTAPLDGVLHPREVLDTLGVDEQESACKQRP